MIATAAVRGEAFERRFQGFRVEVVSGPSAGRSATADGTELSMGTAEGNHLLLADPTVSRHHAIIAVTARGFILRDLGSRNGTWLGNYRVEAAYLAPGAAIVMGCSRLRFDTVVDPIRQALSMDDRFGNLLGGSQAMRAIFALLPRIAASDATILLEGETGTGKGLLARAIHDASGRSRGPFSVLDCGAIPPSLIESELFGNQKGAFTGATNARSGVFEAAHGGTVFLDEIGELPLEMQPKLLRALEDREIRRLGGTETVRLDIRIVAATNRDLRASVNRGAFRPDLLYRLNTVRLRIPPLRERREDIPQLVAHFYRQFAGGGRSLEPPSQLIAHLKGQDWPGNVRELRSAVERSLLMEDPQAWGQNEERPVLATNRSHFDPRIPFRVAKEQLIADWEKVYLTELVGTTGGNVSAAARAARMDRNYLRELLSRYQISPSED